MLKQIRIHNYKCFVDFKLDLPRMSVFVGSNGSGKSSLWEVLAGLQDHIVRGADVGTAFPSRTLTRWRQNESAQRFDLEVEIGDEKFQYDLEIVHDPKRKTPAIQSETLTMNDRPIQRIVDGKVTVQNGHPLEQHLNFSRKISYISAIDPHDGDNPTVRFRNIIANIWLISLSPKTLTSMTSTEAYWLDRDGANFASWFRGIVVERPEIMGQLLAELQPAMPGLKSIAFERLSSEARELMFTFVAENIDYKISASELSDGQRCLLFLYGFLLGALNKTATVFIDEPETGLAPHEMQPWVSTMASAIDENRGQAFVASHHPGFIDYIAAAHTIQFRRPHGGPAKTQDVTLETTGGVKVCEWISPPWAYEDDDDSGNGDEQSAEHRSDLAH